MNIHTIVDCVDRIIASNVKNSAVFRMFKICKGLNIDVFSAQKVVLF